MEMSFNLNMNVDRSKFDELCGESIESGMTGVAEKAQEIAQELVAVDTGALQESTVGTVEGKGKNAKAIIQAGNDEVDYALYVEEGTSKMAAQPFLRPTLDRKEELMAAFLESSKEI